MAETAAHLIDHVFPPLPVRQWVLAVPKWLPGTRPTALVLTPLELITKIAALVPPPRAHRHRYSGVLAPNAPPRSVVTALAPAAVAPASTSAAAREEPRHRAVAHYLWAMLLARIYVAFPRLCPICHGQMGIIAFINDAGTGGKLSITSANPPSHQAVLGGPFGGPFGKSRRMLAQYRISELFGERVIGIGEVRPLHRHQTGGSRGA